MKLSAKKKGQLYDQIHETIYQLRIDLRCEQLTGSLTSTLNKVDYELAQLETKLYADVIKVLDPKTDWRTLK